MLMTLAGGSGRGYNPPLAGVNKKLSTYSRGISNQHINRPDISSATKFGALFDTT